MRLKGKKVLGLLLSGSLAFGMVISSNVTGEGITAKAETNISAMQSNHMAAKNVVKSIEYINGKNAFRIKFQNENYFGKRLKEDFPMTNHGLNRRNIRESLLRMKIIYILLIRNILSSCTDIARMM